MLPTALTSHMRQDVSQLSLEQAKGLKRKAAFFASGWLESYKVKEWGGGGQGEAMMRDREIKIKKKKRDGSCSVCEA